MSTCVTKWKAPIEIKVTIFNLPSMLVLVLSFSCYYFLKMNFYIHLIQILKLFVSFFFIFWINNNENI